MSFKDENSFHYNFISLDKGIYLELLEETYTRESVKELLKSVCVALNHHIDKKLGYSIDDVVKELEKKDD